ncbi:class IIb bacteriocin, lactobin A/cerein 7B family [Flavobacterium sp. LPB0248]|nr:class IIb bacteriocin, lactobin A/cerein 7B family [Flavobacterium sp. LPB0248]QLC66697.1 class IIb bacteriocin, lactobin A/cerein 7B family [Flavobacterium sp. LPB0248]
MESALANLEELNLVELNVQESQEVEGGFLPLAIVVAWYLIGPYGTHKAY